MTDAELVRAALAGSRDAYAQIAVRWVARITAVCHARVRSADVADDLAQETLLRGLRSLHTLSDPSKVGTWLMGIGCRAALDWLKAKERTTVPFSKLDPTQPLDGLLQHAGEDYAQREERRRLMREVENLPEPLRQVVMLYYYDDLSYRELGELLGVSAATVNARLTKARTMLRERLTEPISHG